MSRTELAQVMPWRERVPWNGTASRGQNTLRVYTILLQGKQPKTTLSISHEQSWACSSYAMARKSAMKWNSFARTMLQLLFLQKVTWLWNIVNVVFVVFSYFPFLSFVIILTLHFSDDSFLCEKRRGLLRALPWNILLVLNSGVCHFFCLQNWPLGQSY